MEQKNSSILYQILYSEINTKSSFRKWTEILQLIHEQKNLIPDFFQETYFPHWLVVDFFSHLRNNLPEIFYLAWMITDLISRSYYTQQNTTKAETNTSSDIRFNWAGFSFRITHWINFACMWPSSGWATLLWECSIPFLFEWGKIVIFQDSLISSKFQIYKFRFNLTHVLVFSRSTFLDLLSGNKFRPVKFWLACLITSLFLLNF